jgi:glycyl-tRNA synthetase
MANEKPAQGGEQDLMEKIVSLAKRRGFIYPSSEIYGGINGFWDYGPLGVELKRNIKEAWWQDIVRCPAKGPDGKAIEMVGLDCSIIMNPKVWEASGHVSGFSDPMVDCTLCKSRYRADKVFTVAFIPRVKALEFFEQHDEAVRAYEKDPDSAERYAKERLFRSMDNTVFNPPVRLGIEAETPEEAKEKALATLPAKQRKALGLEPVRIWWSPLRESRGRPSVCPRCGGQLAEARKFNLMFKTFVGAMEDSASVAYLRPETAQGIFANFKNVLDTTRIRVPFGIAQVGKSFRNEINPRNFTFRSREFEQMEIEFFCHESTADAWYEYWRDARYQWYVRHGLKSSKLHLRNHEKEELAHYARACADVEYEFPFGTAELEGVANRTDFDLKAHQTASGRDMTFYNDETKERFIPFVIEPSGGVDRATLAFLCEAYCEDEAPDEQGKPQKRVVLKFHPRLAPIKVAVFPLVKKDGMPEKAQAICDALRPHMTAFYDEKGAVGRRYRRQDEAGTPFCITVDGQTHTDGTVTIRDRDSMKQERIPGDPKALVAYFWERLRS